MKSFKSFMTEAGRCWKGYKPVKGKKPYSDDSCEKIKEEKLVEGSPIVVMPAPIGVRNPKKEIQKLDLNNIGTPAKPPSGEKRGVKGRPGQRPMPTYEETVDESAAWQRKEGKNPEGGLNRKGIESYRRENPGSKLSMAVTTKPSKLKPGSKAANRRKSFCARMGGMEGPMKKPNGEPTRKALALRKWNC